MSDDFIARFISLEQYSLYCAVFFAIFCGLLIFICVDIFKKKNTLVGIFFCIPVFILCGFEHSIADMFYLFNARVFSWEAVLFIAVVAVGNAVGGLFIPVCSKVIAAGKPKQE